MSRACAPVSEQRPSQIIAEASYELADPTIDSQIVQLKAAGVDTLIEQSAAKASAQSIRKVHELNWSPLHIIGGSYSIGRNSPETGGPRRLQGTGDDAVSQAAGRSGLGQ